MAWTNVKTAIIATAAAAALVGAPAAVVTYRVTRPDARQAASVAQVAPVVPILALDEAPPPAGDWRGRFNAVYGLDPGIPLKRVARPYIPERDRYFDEHDRAARPGNGIRRMFDLSKGISVFTWDGAAAGWSRWTLDEPTVGNLFRFVGGVPSYKLRMDEFDRMQVVDGDWVVRPDATEEQRVAAMIEAFQGALAQPLKIEKRAVEREVFVARGKLNVVGKGDGPGQPPLLYVALEKRKAVNNHAIGELPDFLRTLGELMNTEVLDESDAAASKGKTVYWTNQAPGAVAGEFRQKLLKGVTDQTGLTFTLERRKRDTWVVDESK